MALVVESGQGGADSESLCSVAFADSYHSGRGNAAWAVLTTGAKEVALRKATDYMEQAYRLRWTGYRCSDTQALSWPRYEVPRQDAASNAAYGYGVGYYKYDSVPSEVQKACAELALKASSVDLAPDVDRPTTSETVGPLSVTYAAGARETVKFRAVDNLLAPLLNGGMNIKVSRT